MGSEMCIRDRPTATVKQKSRIRWHNFVEVLSFTDDKAVENVRHYQQVAHTLQAALATAPVPHRTTLVPHAPYSISPETFRLINAATEDAIISFHNQEHPAEDELYRTGTGPYLAFFRIFGLETSPFPVTGQSSIRSCLPYFNKRQTVFLVHNTYMPEEDVQWANAYAHEHGLKLVYCICANANRYIENRLPPVEQLVAAGCHVVLGTDSYSSNWQVSIAAEMQTLLQHTTLTKEQVLQMATRNGARALRWDDALGSFEPGKQPGVVLVANDFSKAERII